MNAETLERLLIDRSLGALTPDAAALLEEHLRREPAAAAAAAEIDAVVATARRALADRNPPAAEIPARVGPIGRPDGASPASSLQTRPDPPLPPFEPEKRRAARAARFWPGLSLAACVALGVLLGRASLREPVEPGRPAGSIFSRAAAQHAATGAPDEFWSVRRIWRQHEQTHAATGNGRLVWTSVVRRPTIRGAS